MKSLVQYILEKQGIFNGCEDIANELTVKIVNKIRNNEINEYNRLKFSFDASNYNPIFKDDIIIDIAFFSDMEQYNMFAKTSFDDNVLDQVEFHMLALSAEEVEDIRRKPYKIEIDCNSKVINLYELKGLLMHEITHFYTAIIFYDKKSNFFNIDYYSPKDWEEDSEKLLYYIQKEEVSAFVAQFKGYLDRIKHDGFDNVFAKLKSNEKLKTIIKFKNEFDTSWEKFDFVKKGLGKYPQLYNEHKGTKFSDEKIFKITKTAINKAYNQLVKNIMKMINEYKGTVDFIDGYYRNTEFKISKYMPQNRTHIDRA